MHAFTSLVGSGSRDNGAALLANLPAVTGPFTPLLTGVLGQLTAKGNMFVWAMAPPLRAGTTRLPLRAASCYDSSAGRPLADLIIGHFMMNSRRRRIAMKLPTLSPDKTEIGRATPVALRP